MGIKICSATIIKAERECFQNLEEFENVIREKLKASTVIHCDETGMKVEGKRHLLHVVSNGKYTCYLAHQKRGSEAMDAMRILPDFSLGFCTVLLLLGSAEGHEYPDLQVGDEVDPRLFLIPIKIYNIDPL